MAPSSRKNIVFGITETGTFDRDLLNTMILIGNQELGHRLDLEPLKVIGVSQVIIESAPVPVGSLGTALGLELGLGLHNC